VEYYPEDNTKQNPSLTEYIFSLFNESICELTVNMADRLTANSHPNKNIQDSHSQQTNRTIRQTCAVQGHPNKTAG
jgi:hypothetical protein